MSCKDLLGKLNVGQDSNERTVGIKPHTHARTSVHVRNIHSQYGPRLLSTSYDIDFAFGLTRGQVES